MASLHTAQVQPATKDRHSDQWGGRECLLSRRRAYLSCSVYLRPPSPYCFLPPEGSSMDGWVIRNPPSLHPSGSDKQLKWQAEIASDLHVFTSQSVPPTSPCRLGEVVNETLRLTNPLTHVKRLLSEEQGQIQQVNSVLNKQLVKWRTVENQIREDGFMTRTTFNRFLSTYNPSEYIWNTRDTIIYSFTLTRLWIFSSKTVKYFRNSS